MNTRAYLTLFLLLVITPALTSCATSPRAKVRDSAEIRRLLKEPYTGLKARMAVVRFIDKSAKGPGQIGEGLAEMLTTSLFKTNRYILLDRQNLDAVINEQDFAEAGRISEKTAARVGEIEGVDLMVFGAVTAFEPEHLGAGGFLLGAVTLGASIAIASANEDAPVGAITYKESYVAIDLKIVDTKTGRIVSATSVEGRYYNYGGGVLGAVGGGDSRTPLFLGGFAGTGAEEAIRKAIETAVVEIVHNTPVEYYSVSDDLDDTPVGMLASIQTVTLLEGLERGRVDQPQSYVIKTQKQYEKLLYELDAPIETSPVFDWTKRNLIAVFAGEKPEKGYKIAITRAIYTDDALVIHIKQAAPAPLKEGDPPRVDYVGPHSPFDVVSIAKPVKPVRFVWEE